MLGTPTLPTVHVYIGHVPILRVYQQCMWTLVPIAAGNTIRWLYQGIAAIEIESVMASLGIRERRRRRVFRGVRTMAAAAAKALNEA